MKFITGRSKTNDISLAVQEENEVKIITVKILLKNNPIKLP